MFFTPRSFVISYLETHPEIDLETCKLQEGYQAERIAPCWLLIPKGKGREDLLTDEERASIQRKRENRDASRIDS